MSRMYQKPIAGLDASKFGCVNFPIYPVATSYEESMLRSASFITTWINAGYKTNKIAVFDDLRTNLQDNYEAAWDVTFAGFCTYMDEENQYILGARNGYKYTFDINRRLTSYETEGGGISGYGKWLKDW